MIVDTGFGLGMRKCFEKRSWELGLGAGIGFVEDRRVRDQVALSNSTITRCRAILPGNLRRDYAPRMILAK